MAQPRNDDGALRGGADEVQRLVVAFQQGERGAAAAIYERYAPSVARVCRRMLADPDDADEAAQETFLRVYRGLPSFNGRYELGAWMTRIATNVCVDRLRAESRRPLAPVAPQELDSARSAPDGDPEWVLLHRAGVEDVHDVLSKLPPLQRAAVVLKHVEGFSNKEVAAALNVRESYVKTLLFRGRGRFRNRWLERSSAALAPVAIVHRLFGLYERARDRLAASGRAALQVVPATAARGTTSLTGAAHACGEALGQRGVAMVTAVTVAAASAGVAGGLELSKRPQSHPQRHVTAGTSTPRSASGAGTAVSGAGSSAGGGGKAGGGKAGGGNGPLGPRVRHSIGLFVPVPHAATRKPYGFGPALVPTPTTSPSPSGLAIGESPLPSPEASGTPTPGVDPAPDGATPPQPSPTGSIPTPPPTSSGATPTPEPTPSGGTPTPDPLPSGAPPTLGPSPTADAVPTDPGASSGS